MRARCRYGSFPRLTKASATVALSGEGADELFGGYLMQRASLLAGTVRRLPPPVLRAMLAMAERWPVSNDKIGFEYKLKRFLEGCLMPAARAHVHWSGTFDDSEKRALVQPDAARGARFRVSANWRRRAKSLRGIISGSTKSTFFRTIS